MKKIILPAFIFFQLFFLFSCSKKEEKKGIDFGKAKVKIENDTYNFGTINKGEVVETEFVIKNISDVPFIIRSARGTCSCTTVSSWTKKEIYKGEEAKVKVIFDSNKSNDGDQEKSITLLTNSSKNCIILTLKGNVKVS